MSGLQPYRQQLEAVSQSSTAIVQLSQRFELQVTQHELWSLAQLLESIVQDGFEATLQQAQNDPHLHTALIQARHHYRSVDKMADWVVGWRNDCFWAGRIEVVVDADAWLLKHSQVHLARINRPIGRLEHHWAQPLERGACTALVLLSTQLLVGTADGFILRYDLNTGAVLQEHHVQEAVQCLVATDDGFLYSTQRKSVFWQEGPLWESDSAIAAAWIAEDHVDDNRMVVLASEDGVLSCLRLTDGFCLARHSLSFTPAQMIWGRESLFIRSAQGELWRASHVSSETAFQCAPFKTPISELISLEKEVHGERLMVATALGALAVLDLDSMSWTDMQMPMRAHFQSIHWDGQRVLAMSASGQLLRWDGAHSALRPFGPFRFGPQVLTASNPQAIWVQASAEMLMVMKTVYPPAHTALGAIQKMQVSEDGALLACLTEGDVLEFIDVYAEKTYPRLQGESAVSAFSPNAEQSRLIFRDGSRWRQNGAHLECEAEGAGWIRAAALGPQELWAILQLDGNILLHSYGRTEVHRPPSAAVHMVFAPNASVLMVALAHGGLWSIKLQTHSSEELSVKLNTNVKTMVFSRDSRWLLLSGTDGFLGLWNVSLGGWLWRIRWRRPLTAACFSSDSKFLYLCSTHELIVFERSKGKVVSRYTLLEPIVDMVSLSGDRICLASAAALHFFQWRQPDRRLC